MKKEKKILFSFVGNQDPYGKSGHGPILRLLDIKQGAFNAVYLFHTIDKDNEVSETMKVIKDTYPNIETIPLPINTNDPTNYKELLTGLRRHASSLMQEHPGPFYIGLASGSPQMQATWLLLAASSEIPATLLYVRNPEDMKKNPGQDSCFEINPKANWFPTITPTRSPVRIKPGLDVNEIETALKNSGIVGSEQTINQIVASVSKAAKSYSNIMIYGESGTGKDLLARFIHEVSGREGPFIIVHCGAIPDTLIESELFGYEPGAFTDAKKTRKGAFEMADKGTLFLDEIGDMSPAMQVKILRVVQDGTLMRLGGNKDIRVKVRLIAATNRKLQTMTQQGLFREDLYYRLIEFPITLPPLRKRRIDIPILAEHFLAILNDQYSDRERPKQITKEAINKLLSHGWDGNIRELRHVVNRAYLLSDSAKIGEDDIQFEMSVTGELSPPEIGKGFYMPDFIRGLEEDLVRKAMEQGSGNQRKAAKLLGITPQALSKRLSKRNVDGETPAEKGV